MRSGKMVYLASSVCIILYSYISNNNKTGLALKSLMCTSWQRNRWKREKRIYRMKKKCA